MTLTRVLTGVVTSGAIVVLVAGGLLLVGAPSASDSVWYAGFAMVALAAVLAGVVVSLREPANIVALLLASIGLIVAYAAVRDVYWHAVAQSGGVLAVPGDVVVAGLRQATVWGVVAMCHLLGLTAGGLGKTYETVRGRQGFGYQGVLDPTGTYFYNRLTHWLTGYRNGTWACTQEVYLKKVPLPPLDWDVQRWCGGGYYPYK